jgi:adenylate cyclase
MGGIYLWSRRHDEAVREFEKSISLDPNFALGYIMLGLSLYYGGKAERALDVFDRVFALDPYHPDVYLHFQAQAYFQLGQFEKAGNPEAAACPQPGNGYLARAARVGLRPSRSQR